MAKLLPETEQLLHCSTELGVLKGVIDYADRMIAEDGSQSPYASLRRHAYGKTVVINSSCDGTLVFRLSATALTYPNFASGYATPHSPVGRLCSVLRPGDTGISPKWGEYRVIETLLFDRFDGMEFEDNVRNFLRMVVEGDNGNAVVSDLRHTLHTLQQGLTKQKPRNVLPECPTPQAEVLAETLPAATLPSEHLTLPLAHLEVAEDSDAEGYTAEIDDTDETDEADRASADEYFGLSEVFYLNRTREQDEVIARTPIGVMFVEGVADSGKTSAALGRTKMLCDFKESSV